MIESVLRRFGLLERLPMVIKWLPDDGSPCKTAREARALGPRDQPCRCAWSTDVIDKRAFSRQNRQDRDCTSH